MDPNVRNPDNDTPEQLPRELAEDLAALDGRPVDVPPEVDEAVLAMARQRLAPKRRWRLAFGAAGAAAAAALLVAVVLWQPRAEHSLADKSKPAAVAMENSFAPLASAQTPATEPTLTDRKDIDQNGRLDILDAFALARHLQAGQQTRQEWDFNGDGRVNTDDVDALARAAVRVGKEPS